MDVWHDADFGIGVRVKPIAAEINEKHDGCYDSYFSELLENTPFSFGTVGCTYSNSSDELEYYIYISKPFADGYNIKKKVTALYMFLKKIKMEYEGEVDINGGIYIS